MNLLQKLIVVAMSICMLWICDMNKTIINAKNLSDCKNVQPYGQIIPVNKNFSVFASCKNGDYALVIFNVKGTYERSSNAITNINLNYTYFVNVSGITSYSVESADVSYKTTGNKLYAIATTTLKVVSNGQTMFISGSNSVQL